MSPKRPPQKLADSVYEQLKSELFEFKLLPGDRFTEAEVAERTGTSRTPVRQALYRLERERFLDVKFRNGWEVRPLDFTQIDELYVLRILLEQTSVRSMKSLSLKDLNLILPPLEAIWQVSSSKRSSNISEVAKWDEDFHCALVSASGNREFARVHLEVTERIRIVRRLDFTKPSRIASTYQEHASMLQALRKRAFTEVTNQLATHIEISRIEAREITLLKLQSARKDFSPHTTSSRPLLRIR